MTDIIKWDTLEAIALALMQSLQEKRYLRFQNEHILKQADIFQIYQSQIILVYCSVIHRRGDVVLAHYEYQFSCSTCSTWSRWNCYPGRWNLTITVQSLKDTKMNHAMGLKSCVTNLVYMTSFSFCNSVLSWFSSTWITRIWDLKIALSII